jgi:hypothetical protein
MISWHVWRWSGILTPFVARVVMWIMFWNAGCSKAWIGYHQISTYSASADWLLCTWSVDMSHSMVASWNRSLWYGITLSFCGFSLRCESRRDCFSLAASFWHWSRQALGWTRIYYQMRAVQMAQTCAHDVAEGKPRMILCLCLPQCLTTESRDYMWLLCYYDMQCTPGCTVTCAPLHNSNAIVVISTLDERNKGK